MDGKTWFRLHEARRCSSSLLSALELEATESVITAGKTEETLKQDTFGPLFLVQKTAQIHIFSFLEVSHFKFYPGWRGALIILIKGGVSSVIFKVIPDFPRTSLTPDRLRSHSRQLNQKSRAGKVTWRFNGWGGGKGGRRAEWLCWRSILYSSKDQGRCSLVLLMHSTKP